MTLPRILSALMAGVSGGAVLALIAAALVRAWTGDLIGAALFTVLAFAVTCGFGDLWHRTVNG